MHFEVSENTCCFNSFNAWRSSFDHCELCECCVLPYLGALTHRSCHQYHNDEDCLSTCAHRIGLSPLLSPVKFSHQIFLISRRNDPYSMAGWFLNIFFKYPRISSLSFPKLPNCLCSKGAELSSTLSIEILRYYFIFFQNFFKLSSMATPSNELYEPLVVKVRSKDEGEVFTCLHQQLLNGCTIQWEAGHNVQSPLLTPSDPQLSCTNFHPLYLDLGLKFPLSLFLK